MTIRDIAVAFGFDVDQRSVSAAEGTIKNLKSMATKLLGAIGIGFSVSAMKNFTKECMQIASDVSEMESKFEVVFGNMTDEVNSWAENYADSIGRSRSTIKTYLADQQNLLVGFTDGSEEARASAAKLSEEMTSLALDIASFANTDEDIAVERMTKAVMGESEAAKGLGAVLNDLTRQEAMQRMGLNGSYTALDQYTKMLVNLNAIQYQSKDAIGDCANSMDRYESRTRQLAAKQKSLKEFIGTQLMPVMSAFTGMQIKLMDGAQKVAKAILGESEEDNKLLKVMDRSHALLKKMQPAFDRFCKTVSSGMNKARSFIQNVADKIGGMEQLLKILAITAAAFFTVMNWNKITSTAGGFLNILKIIGKMFSVANLKIMAVVAAVVVLALIIEDFIHFLLGNDSVIGTIFDKAGIGADNARQSIIDAWDKVKAFLLGAWDFIQQAAGMFVNAVKGFFEKHGDSIRQNFEKAWGIIKKFLIGVWTFISQLAKTLFGNTQSSIGDSANGTKESLLEVWNTILETLLAIWNALYEVGSAVFNAIATVIEAVFGWIQTFWSNWGDRILSWFKVLWDSAGGVLSGFLEIVKGIANFISSIFSGDWQGVWEAIKQIFVGVWSVIINFFIAILETVKMLLQVGLSAIQSVWTAVWDAIKEFFVEIWNGILSFLEGIVSGIITRVGSIKDAIVSGIQEAVDWIKGLPSEALQWGADIITGIAKGITSAASKVTDAVSSVAEKIRSFLHFSVPDEGPLVDYERWMPDFMSGLADGISKNENTVLDRIKDLARGISTLTKASVAQPATATTSTVNNKTSNVTQNVNIDNTYSGGSADAQKAVSRTMRKSATDATTQMARALAYARG